MNATELRYQANGTKQHKTWSFEPTLELIKSNKTHLRTILMLETDPQMPTSAFASGDMKVCCGGTK